jgi:hypothetical protein
MSKTKTNKSIEFSIDEDNFNEIINNISSRNSINTSGSLIFEGIQTYHMPLIDKEEVMKKREFLNKVVDRYL